MTMPIHKLTLFIFFLCVVTGHLKAQERSNSASPSFIKRLNEAQIAFDRSNYLEAIRLFENIKRRHPLPDSSKVQLAKAYFETDHHEMAEAVYMEVGMEKLRGDALYWYAQTLRYNSKYLQADLAMDKFLKEKPDDPKAQRWIQTDFSTQQVLQEKRYHINLVTFNSRFSDFSPIIQNGIMYFTSSRPAPALLKNKKAESFLNIYRVEEFNQASSSPKLNSTEFKTRYNDGPVAFNRHGTEAFITRNIFSSRIKEQDQVNLNRLSIVRSVRSSDGSWQSPEVLPFNDPSYSCAHAFLTEDGDRLYFASNRPGGYGESDIYYVERNNQGWGLPVNLGPEINTFGNEMFPFVDEEGLIYFASDGHPGLGGLDLFAAKRIEEKYIVKNLGYPLNSSKDDFSLFLNNGSKDGYFASNRPGGMGNDDIYKFEILNPVTFEVPRKKYTGIVRNQNTQRPLPKAILGVLDQNGAFLLDLTTNLEGVFFLPDTISKDITIIAAEEHFYPYEQSFSLATLDDTIMVNLRPKPVYGIHGIITGEEENHPISAVPIYVYTGQSLIDTAYTENDGSFRIQLHPYSDYSLVCYKSGFFPIATTYSTFDKDTGYIDLNRQASLKLNKIITDHSFVVNLTYQQNQLNPTDATIPLLNALYELLIEYPHLKIEIRTHTSSKGAASINMQNSRARAQAVASYLKSKGIDSSRIVAKGYGETSPVNQCSDSDPCSEEEHQQNERTEIIFF
ncbi:OmpA family protein [Thermophagus sp. OGC60D27]|uniref:OmpA family protein n=1 Tax=Thermophagus sp. OGC60D27 TaxID=3458415 RepID=UPI0040378D34